MPRQLPIMLGGDPATMTIAECAQRCKDRYLTVFAVQYGGECFGCKSQRRWALSTLADAHKRPSSELISDAPVVDIGALKITCRIRSAGHVH
jgi:hypothetical protein